MKTFIGMNATPYNVVDAVSIAPCERTLTPQCIEGLQNQGLIWDKLAFSHYLPYQVLKN